MRRAFHDQIGRNTLGHLDLLRATDSISSDPLYAKLWRDHEYEVGQWILNWRDSSLTNVSDEKEAQELKEERLASTIGFHETYSQER